MDGVTLRYGVPGGRLRRSEVGELARRAQSSGEWPGSRITLRDGLAGLVECVGGGASVEVPGCRADEARLLGGARPPPPPPREGPGESEELLLTPLSRGGRGGGGMSDEGGAAAGVGTGAAESEGTLGGAMAPLARATAAAEAGGCGDSDSEGTDPEDVDEEAEAARAFGVVCGDDASAPSLCGATIDGGEGIAEEDSACDCVVPEEGDLFVVESSLLAADSDVVFDGCSI
jgi:hypothetical protein